MVFFFLIHHCFGVIMFLQLLWYRINLIFDAWTKHVEVDYHFVQERVLRLDLRLKFIASNDQFADILTKGLSSSRFLWLASKFMKIKTLFRQSNSKQCRNGSIIKTVQWRLSFRLKTLCSCIQTVLFNLAKNSQAYILKKYQTIQILSLFKFNKWEICVQK